LLLNNLYTIESQTKSEQWVTSSLKLDANHAIFKGHFPGQPVLPGVCMLEMISEIMGGLLKKNFHISAAPLVKFLRMIDPRKNPDINVEINYQEKGSGVAAGGKIFCGPEIFMKFQLTLLADPV
jgi:3-hydroxyacyl-[acyl-carrier-protein] dehydratase